MIEPNGCRHCGVREYSHCQLWADDVGWHQFAEPTDVQRLERMRERRRRRFEVPVKADASDALLLTITATDASTEAIRRAQEELEAMTG